jgi:two-component system, NarL family, sensor histidine kinase YdfH
MGYSRGASSRFISLPFYLFMSLLLGALGVSAALTIWQAGAVALSGLVVLLAAAHIGLYWLNIWLPKGPRWWALYYIAQTCLAVGLVLLTHTTSDLWISVLGSTIICLIGEALGWWGNSRVALLLGLFYVGLATALLALLLDQAAFLVALANMLINGGFVVLLMALFNQQLIERQRATELAESLESANAKLAAYAGKIESLTLQTERQRMARELHDTLAQGVAGLVLQLEAVRAHLAASRPERAAAIVDQALARARSTLAESRAAIDDLRAEGSRLPEALRASADRFSQATGIPCRVDLAGDLAAIDGDLAGHTISILGEALANIARHAQATEVTIRCGMRDGRLELEVCDNGRGFDTGESIGVGHYGLLGMRERARLLAPSLARGATICAPSAS